ncbi:hypothetical protein RHMOL_Rhmol03G0156200 [Rhododendron molle]|uniref:Uncharacterized protein n=1 Tax=Rhododendron molle TaxID=49168 RepID=A0ACC0PEV4_RHOML|nr:hypothetical protein RHMOL_Rhmol03G0156200 [Rhododendron molle]
METISQRRKSMETICVFYVISPMDSSNFPKGPQPFAEKSNLFCQALEFSSFLANWCRLGFECCLKHQLAAYGSIFIFWYSRVLSLSYSRRRIKALFGHIAPAEASSQFRESSQGGHTAEMLNLLSVLHADSFTPRLYIAAATDNMSLRKARLFENSVIDKIMFTAVPSGSNCCYVSIVAFQTDFAFLSCIGSSIFCFGSSFGFFWIMATMVGHLYTCGMFQKQDCIVLSIHASALFWLSSNVAATALLD